MPAKGIKRVKMRLAQKVQEIDGARTNAAVYAILSQGAAVAATMTPVDTSTLINSQTAPQLSHKTGKTTGTVGYTAKYAAAVHEAPGKLKGQPRADFGRTRAGVAFGGGTGKGNYWDPAGEPGFLREGFEEIKPLVPRILKAAYGSK